MLEESRSTAASLKNNEKHMQVLQKEKEQLQMENGKSLLARSRLEELCRELQRQNKVVKGSFPIFFYIPSHTFKMPVHQLNTNVLW